MEGVDRGGLEKMKRVWDGEWIYTTIPGGGKVVRVSPPKRVNVVLVEWRRGNISSHGEGDAEQLTAFLLEMGWVY